MATVPTPLHTVAASVYEYWKQRGDAEPERAYLGASSLGGPCERKLWYGFRWAEVRKFDGRIYRLFERGRNEEPTIVRELRGIGCTVSDTQPDGSQWGFAACGGHLRGHMDAAACGTPYAPKSWCVVEAKTHSLKSFNELVVKGVKESKPEHWHQMNIYMGQFDMDRAMYYAVCKDDDRIHTEWLHFDKSAFDKMMERGLRIITSAEPPLRLSDDASWYQCKWCDYSDMCHGTAAPRAHCRTCAHVTPLTSESNGTWACDKTEGYWLPVDAQRIGCQKHRYIPVLLENFAEYLGTPDGENPQYKNKLTGATFSNGDYSSQEIRNAQDKRALGDPGVAEFKAVFGARVAA